MPDKQDALVRMLREVLAPLIEADGGQIYLVAVGKKEVALHLAGAWAGAPGADLVARRIIEPAVHAVLPKASVLVTHGWRIPEGAERIGSAA
jgi:Fe-S cluster biogenesis protein NfuA